MEQFKPGIYIARDSKKVKYGGEYEGSWLSKYSFVEPEDFEKVASRLKSGKTGDRPIYTKLKTYHKEIWNSIQKNFGIKEEKFSLSDIIEIQEEVVLKQEGKKIILEKGDKFKVLENNLITKNGWIFKSGNRGYKNRPATLEKEIGYVHYLTIIYYGEGTLLQLKDENMDGETIYKEFSNVEELSSFLNKKYKNNITINEDDLSYFDIFVKESLFKKNSNTICIEEETTINKKGKKIILEKGDRIEVLKEASQPSDKFMPYMNNLCFTRDLINGLLHQYRNIKIINIQTNINLNSLSITNYKTNIETDFPFIGSSQDHALREIIQQITIRAFKLSIDIEVYENKSTGNLCFLIRG